MDLIIFKNGEIILDMFIGKTIKYISYDNLNEIKTEKYGNYIELDKTKTKLEKLNPYLESIRRSSSKYNYDYELLKVLCKKKVISRSYFKIYEMIYFNDIIKLPTLNCIFLCEAPGGFIDALLDIRRKNNLTIDYLTISKNDSIIKYNKYISKESIIYADILNIKIINKIINTSKQKFPNGVDLVTGDGGFDIKKYNSQELFIFPLLLSEIIIALSIQKEGGTFIIKMFDMCTHNTIILYLILCTFYEEVKIIKPLTSRSSNSERYLVCKDFIKINEISKLFIDQLKELFTQIYISEKIYSIIFPDFNIDKLEKIKLIKIINNEIINNQIIAINKSLEMVKNINLFFNKLIIEIFIGKIKIDDLVKYNNILNEKIKLCINWLKQYSINTINVNY